MGKAEDITARLTDTTKYTGSHKERFDETGQGKGIAGRKNVVNNTGSTSSSDRDHTVTSTNSSTLKPIVVKTQTESEKYGEKPKIISLYQYGDKNHQGERFVLTKQKFPTWKQVNEATIKLIPTGKPKLIVDEGGREIKKLEDLVDGAKYLAITGFDLAKRDEAKVPLKFKSG